MQRTHISKPWTGHTRLALVLVALALGACAGVPMHEPPVRPASAGRVPPTPPSDAATDLGRTVTALATDMIGVPYRYGSADPKHGFDCSGLVFYAYSKTGVAVPRTSQEQFKAARKIGLHEAAHGDLIFFQDQAKLSHVGIYLGDGLFVHAPASGRAVSVASLATPYYQRHLVAVGRLLPN